MRLSCTATDMTFPEKWMKMKDENDGIKAVPSWDRYSVATCNPDYLIAPHLRLVVDIADLLDDELEVVVEGQRVGGRD